MVKPCCHLSGGCCHGNDQIEYLFLNFGTLKNGNQVYGVHGNSEEALFFHNKGNNHGCHRKMKESHTCSVK